MVTFTSLFHYRRGRNSPLLGKRNEANWTLCFGIFYIPDYILFIYYFCIPDHSYCAFPNSLLSFNDVIRAVLRVEDLCMFGFTKSHNILSFVLPFLLCGS